MSILERLNIKEKGTLLAVAIPISSNSLSIDAHTLSQFVNKLTSVDDVYRDEFLSSVVFQLESTGTLPIDTDALQLLERWGTRQYYFLNCSTPVPAGPQVIVDGRAAPVYKLYDDNANAFCQAFRSTTGSNRRQSETAPVAIDVLSSRVIAVRSRAASVKHENAPLEGMRMVVKDMFDIQNHRVGLGSKAYLELSEASKKTAPAIQILLDAGASLVGVTQLCAMGESQEPTQCVDYHAPINPRGDRFQSPSGGSSGQPSSIATYAWLDFAIGSDSTRSGRLPAQANGCFAFRPSQGLVSTQGMWSGVPEFDTPCVYARAIDTIDAVARVWCPPSPAGSRTASKAICVPIDFLPLRNQEQMDVFDSLVRDISKCIGAEVTYVSISEAWKQNPPNHAHDASLTEYLNKSIATRTYVFSVWKKISEFYAAYKAKFKRNPFLPLPLGIHVWDEARDVTPEQEQEAWHRIFTYKNWLLDRVLKHEEQDTLVITPLDDVKPNYRDEWPPPPSGDQQLWEPLLMSPILGCPELVVPAGQIHHDSRISGCPEVLPVCVSILGPKWSDLDLISTAAGVLRQSGRPSEVLVGRTMFPTPEPTESEVGQQVQEIQ